MVRVFQIAESISQALLADGDLDTVATAQLGDTLHYYTQEDYERQGGLIFPYAHTFCHRRTSNTREVMYGVSIAISAIRLDSEKSARTTTETSSDNIGIVSDKIVEVIKDEMGTFGLAGETGFRIENISEVLISPRGEKDMQYILGFDIIQKNCM